MEQVLNANTVYSKCLDHLVSVLQTRDNAQRSCLSVERPDLALNPHGAFAAALKIQDIFGYSAKYNELLRLVLAFAFRLGVDSDGPLEEAQRVDLDSFVKHVVSMSNVKEQLFLKFFVVEFTRVFPITSTHCACGLPYSSQSPCPVTTQVASELRAAPEPFCTCTSCTQIPELQRLMLRIPPTAMTSEPLAAVTMAPSMTSPMTTGLVTGSTTTGPGMGSMTTDLGIGSMTTGLVTGPMTTATMAATMDPAQIITSAEHFIAKNPSPAPLPLLHPSVATAPLATSSPRSKAISSKSYESWLLNALVQHLYHGDTSLLPRGSVQAKGISSKGYQSLASHPDCPDLLREKIQSMKGSSRWRDIHRGPSQVWKRASIFKGILDKLRIAPSLEPGVERRFRTAVDAADLSHIESEYRTALQEVATAMDSLSLEDYQNSLQLYVDPSMWEGPALRNSHQNGNLKALAAYLDRRAPNAVAAVSQLSQLPSTSQQPSLLHQPAGRQAVPPASVGGSPLIKAEPTSSTQSIVASAAIKLPEIAPFSAETSTLPLDSDDEDDMPGMGAMDVNGLVGPSSVAAFSTSVPKRAFDTAPLLPSVPANATSKRPFDVPQSTSEQAPLTCEPPPKRARARTRSIHVQTDPHLPLMDQILESGLDEAQETLLWDLHEIATSESEHAADCKAAIEGMCTMWNKTWARHGEPIYERTKQGFESSLAEVHRKYTVPKT